MLSKEYITALRADNDNSFLEGAVDEDQIRELQIASAIRFVKRKCEYIYNSEKIVRTAIQVPYATGSILAITLQMLPDYDTEEVLQGHLETIFAEFYLEDNQVDIHIGLNLPETAFFTFPNDLEINIDEGAHNLVALAVKAGYTISFAEPHMVGNFRVLFVSLLKTYDIRDWKGEVGSSYENLKAVYNTIIESDVDY